MTRHLRTAMLTAACLLTAGMPVHGHSGPPFPIATDTVAGPYVVSVWTDPDTTDDGRPGGQFWVELAPAENGATLPAGTTARVAIRPMDREGALQEQRAEPVNGAVSRQFAVLLMDHEGPFAVRVSIDGPLGPGTVDSQVEATYDARPAAWLIAVFLLPFAGLALLWVKALRHRRGAAARRQAR